MSKKKRARKNEEQKQTQPVAESTENNQEVAPQEQTEASQNDELQKCQEELESYKDKYLRAVADFDNSKKRLEREKSDAVAFANESFAKDLLTVLDTFEQALHSIDQIKEPNEEAIEKIKEGINLTYNQLVNILKKHGVEEIESEGEFDPNLHQVVMQEESDNHKSGEIVKVLQKGYKLKDRLLRPAMVSSCK
ncbi:MAG: nucleotide exchange factor GrpE [Epsilonproteobacteria bacterium]|nr:nucleotide exchange factor GrpE [Campylobacterota bacterium]